MLFDQDAITPELFGGYSASLDFRLSGVASSALHIVQSPPVLLWNSAVYLARNWWDEKGASVATLPAAKGMRVLDLGAGLGVCSLTAAALGAKEVVACEIEPALQALRASLRRNSHSCNHDRIVAVELPWGVGAEHSIVHPGDEAFDVRART